MSTDCGTGNYCAGNKRCACLTTYVEIDSYCWRKINPGESGCTQNRQCEAVWPGAYCRSGVNLILRTFQSFNSRRNAVAQTTNPLFAQGMVLFAWTTAFARWMATTQNSELKIKFSSAMGVLMPLAKPLVHWHMIAFVTVRTAQSTTQLVFVVLLEASSWFHPQIILPTAFACIQPPNEGFTPPGGGSALNHWYHDPITGECRELKYQGYGGNANNFQTKDHCESYCKQSESVWWGKLFWLCSQLVIEDFHSIETGARVWSRSQCIAKGRIMVATIQTTCAQRWEPW